MKKKNTKDNKIIVFIRVILLIIIICCSIYILTWFIENQKNSNMLSKITEESVIDTVSVQVPITDENGETEKTLEIMSYELDFNKLFSVNNETVGWISVPNTSINYPVAKANDNSFYLNHSFDKSKNTAGWIFADYRNSFNGQDKNIIVYGHNRMDSSMFATLKNTQKSDWYDNENNKYLTFTTPDGVHVYETFSVYTIKAESYYITTDFSNDNSYLDFLNTLKSRSIHDFGVSLNSDDKIITLSTCDASGKSRVVLHAKQIL